ncbi:MAG: virulence RhuM family protein [Candidatus Levybacteria bacterium]|nr:virulence RhuM family protein [Candidatus Levybacteria bacterium]
MNRKYSVRKIPDNQIAFYQSPDGAVNIEVLYARENIWLTQKRIAELFDVERSVVTKHLKNIFIENELDKDSVSAKFAHTAEDGKNYLDKKELAHLNRIGNMYLDYAEMQAARGKAMTMKDWTEKLNAFLKFSEYEILTNAGKISHEVAETLALGEYEKYKKVQDKNYISDFDKEVKKLLKRIKK